MSITDWNRADTVVLYRSTEHYPYPTEAFTSASRGLLDLLRPDIDKPKVTLKPNVVHGVSPDSGITVHPGFLRGIVEYLIEAGIDASAISVAEGGGGEESPSMVEHFANVGYDVLRDELGFSLVDLNADDYVRVDIPSGVVFDQMPIGRTVWDPDAYFINIPKMRTHNLAITTICIKNLQGIVVPIEERHMCTLFPRHKGDRGGNGLDGSILDSHERWAHKICDISLARTPDLNIVDALVPRDGTGFRNGSDRPMGMALAGTNQTAVDTIGTALMGIDPANITYLRIAGERGMGPNRVADIRILEVVDGVLVERNDLTGLVADPPFRVTLSETLTYSTYENVDYNQPELEVVHAGAKDNA